MTDQVQGLVLSLCQFIQSHSNMIAFWYYSSFTNGETESLEKLSC